MVVPSREKKYIGNKEALVNHTQIHNMQLVTSKKPISTIQFLTHTVPYMHTSIQIYTVGTYIGGVATFAITCYHKRKYTL